jgi:hypothetical protein
MKSPRQHPNRDGEHGRSQVNLGERCPAVLRSCRKRATPGTLERSWCRTGLQPFPIWSQQYRSSMGELSHGVASRPPDEKALIWNHDARFVAMRPIPVLSQFSASLVTSPTVPMCGRPGQEKEVDGPLSAPQCGHSSIRSGVNCRHCLPAAFALLVQAGYSRQPSIVPGSELEYNPPAILTNNGNPRNPAHFYCARTRLRRFCGGVRLYCLILYSRAL